MTGRNNYQGNTNWMRFGACRDVDPRVMFPSDGVGVEQAKTVCDRCFVKDTCLEYALVSNEDFGIWGGASERERRRMRRQRRRAAALGAA